MFALNVLRQERTILSRICNLKQSEIFLPNQKINTTSFKWSPIKKDGEHRPNTLEKYLLVWMKKYPSVAEVPKTVSGDMILKVRDWSRIKINIIMVAITAVACCYMIYSGKKAAGRGESVRKINEKFHEEHNAKHPN